MTIIKKMVSNFNTGRSGYKPEAIVLHIMAGTLPGTDAWFLNPASQVSAHYGIGKNGEIHQYVNEQDTAWHAGRVDAPTWKGIKVGINPNLYTIGIEHEGQADDVWPEAQKEASAALIREICKRWEIPIDRDHIIGHYEIYSKKPNCPATNKSIIDEIVKMVKEEPTRNVLKIVKESVGTGVGVYMPASSETELLTMAKFLNIIIPTKPSGAIDWSKVAIEGEVDLNKFKN
jgi:N-acetyl-anhydromuramyl-L-alanine amidase AmpD